MHIIEVGGPRGGLVAQDDQVLVVAICRLSEIKGWP